MTRTYPFPITLASIVASSLLTVLPAAAQSANEGEQVFKRCAVCHSLEPGTVKIGPPLAGIFGRRAGSVEGFRYSDAMKSADVVWTAETLDRYLAAPKKFIPGNRMPFPGLKNGEDRALLIEYLKQATGAQ